jgi:hypothetical protein
MKKTNVKYSEELVSLFFTVPAIAIAIAAVVVVVYFVTHDEVTVTSDAIRNVDAITNNNPILKIWALKGKKDKTYFVVDEFVENQINDAIDIIKQHNPSYFEKNSEENLRNLLKLNILK